MGRVQLVTWREARRLDDSQAAWAQGTLVGVQATADGRLVLVDPGPPVFQRSSVAYLSNGTQVASGQPRFETVSGRTGVLVEEGTTNLLLWSDQFDNSYWGKFGVTVTANNVTAPNGTQTAETVVEDTSNGGHDLRSGSVSVSGTSYTLSVYAKKGSRKRFGLLAVGNVSYAWATFDLESGTVVATGASNTSYMSVIGARIVYVGDGWYRCSITVNNVNNTSLSMFLRLMLDTQSNAAAASYTGDGASNMYFWGAQLEQKTYATTYVATTSSTATRAAETLTVPTAGVLNPQEGTIEFWAYVDAQVRDTSRTRRFFSHDPGPGNANRITIQHNNTPDWLFTIGDGNGNVHSLGVADSYTPDGWHYFAMVWGSSRFAAFIDGVKRGEVLNPTYLPQSLAATFDIGHAGGYIQANTLIGPLRISSRARTDQEIEAAYAAGPGGLVADEDTTYLLPGDSLAYGRGGYRVAPAIDLSRVGTAWASRIGWDADGATVDVLTSLDGGQSWQQAINGGPVPGISRGMDVKGRSLLVKQRLIAQDMAAAPALRRLDARVIDQPRPGGRPGSVRLLTTGAGKVRLLV